MSVSIKRLLLLIVLVFLLLGACTSGGSVNDRNETAVELRLEPESIDREFARAINVRLLNFPDDHGPHFDYQTEWWYYTGNLKSVTGEQFGYQFTIFRRALAPGAPPESEGLATNQVYFAHVALTDVSGGQHFFEERFSRGAADLAGAQALPFTAWVEDWRVEALNSEASEVHIKAITADFKLDLTLAAEKPIVKHGENGLSAKSDEPGNASYYLSFTRMRTNGQVSVDGENFALTGSSWFDHEWSTSVLGDDAVGWDWLGLQFDDGRELMLYNIRRSDGSIDPISGGTLVDADGGVRILKASDVQINALGSWKSEISGTLYPSGWDIRIPSLGIDLNVEPWLDEQEMRVSFTYWEGAVRISGEQDGFPIGGNGFVELTGYLESMEGVLS